jgi:hypothetical protein
MSAFQGIVDAAPAPATPAVTPFGPGPPTWHWNPEDKRAAEEAHHCDAGLPPEDCDLTPAQAKAKVDAWMASPAGREAVRAARQAVDEREAHSICEYDEHKVWTCLPVQDWIKQGAPWADE